MTQVEAGYSIEEPGVMPVSLKNVGSPAASRNPRDSIAGWEYSTAMRYLGCRDMEGAADQLHQMDLQREISG